MPLRIYNVQQYYIYIKPISTGMSISTFTTRLLAKSRCGHFCPLFDFIVIQSYETALYWLLFYYISYQRDQQDLVQAKYIYAYKDIKVPFKNQVLVKYTPKIQDGHFCPNFRFAIIRW